MPKPEVATKFAEPGIADRVMALLKFTDKKPENLAIALGINRVGGYEAQVEAEMDRLIRDLALPISKTLHGGLTATGERKQGSYVVYGLLRETVPTGQAPKVKVVSEEKSMGVKSRDEAVAAFESALQKLPEVADRHLNQAYVVETLAGLGNAWLYSPLNEIYRCRLKESLMAERKRRAAKRLEGELAPDEPAPDEPEKLEKPPAEDEIDLAEALLGMQRQIEALQQRNAELERELQAGTPAAQEGVEAGLEARQRELTERIEALTERIETLTMEMNALKGERDRLSQKRDAIQEVIELLR